MTVMPRLRETTPSLSSPRSWITVYGRTQDQKTECYYYYYIGTSCLVVLLQTSESRSIKGAIVFSSIADSKFYFRKYFFEYMYTRYFLSVVTTVSISSIIKWKIFRRWSQLLALLKTRPRVMSFYNTLYIYIYIYTSITRQLLGAIDDLIFNIIQLVSWCNSWRLYVFIHL